LLTLCYNKNNNKNTRKISDPIAYKESGIKDAMEDLENKQKLLSIQRQK
jgi:hypothetical protein